MPDRFDVPLIGCRPEPLIDYLKALGVLRVVGEQGDRTARGCWKHQTFHIISALSRESLFEFLLERWEPSPLISPWNGGSGFWKETNKAGRALSALIESTSPRLESYRSIVAEAQRIIHELGLNEKPDKREKQQLLRRLRAELPDSLVQWLDAVCVIEDEGSSYFPLLGTGANDGNLDFTTNFIQRLQAIIPFSTESPTGSDSEEWLNDALFESATPRLATDAVGQFHPGGAGGPNAGSGFSGNSLVNPWDFVLSFEGSLIFAGAMARRYGSDYGGSASFAFTVDESPAGTSTFTEADADKGRKEVWLPLWNRPAILAEVTHTFAEGRAQVGQRGARTGVEFARSIAELGVSRGIDRFVRYGFLQRNGLAYIATPLAHVEVRSQPHANLLQQLDPWLRPLRGMIRGGTMPARIRHGMRRLDDAIMTYCLKGQLRRLQDVLVVLGQLVHAVSLSRELQDRLFPLYHLSEEWVLACDDQSDVYRLAVGLAATDDPLLGPIRRHLEPVRMNERSYPTWDADSPSVVFGGGPLWRNLTAILNRRCIEANSASGASNSKPPLPVRSPQTVSLVIVDRFLRGELDEERIQWLLWSLATIRWDGKEIPLAKRTDEGEFPPRLSRAYALLKLLFHHRPLKREKDKEDIWLKPQAEILSRLRSGDVDTAIRIAARRLHASGMTPIGRLHMLQQHSSTLTEGRQFLLSREETQRIPAALLMTIRSVQPLQRCVQVPERKKTTGKESEDQTA